MNIIPFINSKTVAKHIKEIGHEFTTLEAAYVIGSNQTKSLKSRLAALAEIMETMPDCPLYEESEVLLFASLQKYIDLQQSLVSEFFSAENAIYSFSYMRKDGISEAGNDVMYHDIDTCIEEAKRLNHIYKTFRVTKRVFGISRRFDVILTDNKEVLAILSPFEMTTEEWEILYLFENMSMKFPLPFKEGDSVIERSFFDGGFNSPFYYEEGERLDSLYIRNYLNLDYFKDRTCW